MEYEPVIGLEVHVQLKTESKIFCSCSTTFGAQPNSNTCPVCLGLPGSLPVLNKRALDLAIKVGLALNCHIAERLKFDRKNYFYPDLPKAYQISQFDMPVAAGGYLDIITQDGEKRIGVTRAHLEEDAGKLLHEGILDGSHVDYNRTGTPLLEIVSEPDIRTPDEAYLYLTALKAILEYLEVSDCNMEEGSLRCDANVSIRPRGQEKFGTKAEIKNLNSFRAVQRALEYEIKRQKEAVEEGEEIRQETRLWNDDKGITISMRSKEEAHDYRYFPEPDLVPFTISREIVAHVKELLPELPRAKQERFKKEFNLSEYDASVLVQNKKMASFFEEAVASGVDAKQSANWIQAELLGALNSRGISWQDLTMKTSDFVALLSLIEKGTISHKIAKDVLGAMIDTGKAPAQIVSEKGLSQVSDEGALKKHVEAVIAMHPQSVSDYKSGKKNALSFLMGQVMKESKGKANPTIVSQIFRDILES
jgi:aspartyl-tRNA(Asn)/glutamyl-tRNA(Gln) amidotransferase subunit B